MHAVILTVTLLLSSWASTVLGQGTSASSGSSGDAALTCDDVMLDRTSGRPTHTIDFSSIPSDFGQIPAFKVIDPESGDSRIIPVDGRAGEYGASFVVPVHPNNSAEGGAVTLTLIDGDGASCAPMAFVIEPLPEAPGAFNAFVDLLDRAYDDTKRQIVEPNSQGSDSSFNPLMEIAEDRLRGSNNENSLEKIAAGTAAISPDLTPSAQRVMDGLIRESRILDGLEDYVQKLEQIPSVAPSELDQLKAPPAPDASAAATHDFCQGAMYRPSGAGLSAMMISQAEGAAVRADQALYLAAGGGLAKTVAVLSTIPTAGAVNPVTVSATAISLGISVLEIVREAREKLLPSELTELTFNHNKQFYLEDDQDLTGYWDDVMVTARSQGMSFDTAILNLVFKKAIGGAGTRFLGKYAGDKVIKRTITYQSGLAAGVTTQKVMNKYGDSRGFLHVPACDFGPADITDELYHYAEVVPVGRVLSVVSDKAFIIEETGQGNLVVSAEHEAFGGRSTSAQGPIEVTPIELSISPARVNGDPGYTSTFTVTVDNANDTSVAFSIVPQGGHQFFHEKTGPNTYEVTVVTSENASDFPATLRATSTSKTGLRKAVSAPAREATARLSSGGDVTVAPWSTCVEWGETAQFSATVTGYENKAVTWSATGGTVNSTGLFTAPKQDGNISIEAVSVVDSRAKGNALITVAESCQCWAAVSLPWHDVIATTTQSAIEFGSKMFDRQNELQAITLDFKDKKSILNDLRFEFFPAHHKASVEPSGLTFRLSPSSGHWWYAPSRYATSVESGTYPGKNGVYYNVTVKPDGTVEYYYLDNAANKGKVARKRIAKPYEEPGTGPELDESGRFPVDVRHRNPSVVNGKQFSYSLPGPNRYTMNNPGVVRPERVAVVVKSRLVNLISASMHDEHELEFKDMEFSASPEPLALPVVVSVDTFTTDGSDSYWLQGSATGEVGVFESDDATFTTGPIRAKFQGKFGSPSTLFGDDLGDFFERKRYCEVSATD
ncbi:hypothetical protein H2508_01440 [Parahaliea sp. F7430]|uniref:Ig-like domain-containing protein n=1 Tax=Sediminihaliea albiluteola TaxID=2758564 RepID=A0A7W2YHT4_9GAMM|nr:hypothetical protein [Sediminihaliea albiluteola]MBA6411771.1 hypothetical protein [Sediminihaliea albiluteola]